MFEDPTPFLKRSKTADTIQREEKLVNTFKIGDAFGEEASVVRSKRKLTAVAKMNTFLVTLNRMHITKYLTTYKEALMWNPTYYRSILFEPSKDRTKAQVKHTAHCYLNFNFGSHMSSMCFIKHLMFSFPPG